MRIILLLVGWFLWIEPVAFGADSAGKSIEVKTDDGAIIHCFVAGPQDSSLVPIIFVPGYLMPAEVFEGPLQHFAKERRVVAMDPRSQGKSAKVSYGHSPARRAKDIKAVVDQLGLKKFVLAGWSLAVSEVLSFYEQFSGDVESLILIDGDLSYEVSEKAAFGEIQFLQGVASASQANRPEALRAFVRSLYQNPPPAEDLERITASVLATSEDTSLALLVNRIGFKFGPGLAKISVPVLVVVSEGNRNKDKIMASAKEIPKAGLQVMRGVGHALFLDKKDEFDRLVDEFLGGVGAAGPPSRTLDHPRNLE